MKTHSNPAARRGFTLMELMVAMAITTIIVTVLVSITSIALETWNRSRAELRAARQAKSMIDVMAADFQGMVSRRGNTNEWLSAIAENQLPGGKILSTNASKLIFFTAATDRYDGKIGTTDDKGGDVSCVGYLLDYRDPMSVSGNEFQTFVLNRLLVNPDKTFEDLLGKPDLTAAFSTYSNQLSDPKNFVCENVFQFTVSFKVEVTTVPATGNTPATIVNVPVTIGKTSSGQTTSSFRVKGSGIVAEVSGGEVTTEQLLTGRITAIEISATVISDFGIDQMKRRPFTPTQQAEFMAKNSFQYSKLVQVSSM